jgi:hypothetical protein
MMQLKRHEHFNVTFLSWEQLRDGLISSNDFADRLASNYSVLLGGTDFALDIR